MKTTYTVIKKENGKEISRKEGYKTKTDVENASGSWLRDCTVHANHRTQRSCEIIENEISEHYIRNTKTDEAFDTQEMKFYGSNWEPTMETDKDYLQSLIDNDPEKFENCIIETR